MAVRMVSVMYSIQLGVKLHDVCRSNCPVNITIYEQCNRSVKSICFLTDDQRMGIYGGITLTTIVLNFVRTTLFYLICINASRVLHNRMFKAIIRTSIRFFDTNPSGKLIERGIQAL